MFNVLPTLDAESIDACVTDPPYELEFMGKHWDVTGIAFDVDTWGHVLRVLKPGAHLLAFGGTRKFHWMTCAIEDAGFEIRDCLSWLYGSGFPKSLNLGDGRGTALKPGWEPIILARKPLIGTVAANVLAHGTGALNIDACRIGTGGHLKWSTPRDMGYHGGSDSDGIAGINDLGRWPANVIIDEDAAAMLDEQAPITGSTLAIGRSYPCEKTGNVYGVRGAGEAAAIDNRGGASRFYYVAKPSREERDYGCEGLQARIATVGNLEAAGRDPSNARNYVGGEQDRVERGLPPSAPRRNHHPTVKPVELMRWLVRLVTPPDGVVLDPFTGSGTTGMACRYEQRRFIGIEREAEYVVIAERRIAAVAPLFGEASA
jgi:site-specific DNA-methyltransferase (adenine-specific)